MPGPGGVSASGGVSGPWVVWSWGGVSAPGGMSTPGGGGGIPACTEADPPTREQCMLGDTGNKRVEHILLECIFVLS